MNVIHIHHSSYEYPSSLKRYLSDNAPETITAIGNPDILQNNTLAIFSSKKCPGSLIIKTYDFMKESRVSDITVISGFHSPIERECLNILLRGKQSVIICPARSIENMRIKPEYKKPIEEGRLLFLSPFDIKHNRISSERADKRNQFVAAISDEFFVPYAEPDSKTETLCKKWIEQGKPVRTFESEYTKNLFELGAKPTSTCKMSSSHLKGWTNESL
ncbi:MAG: DNA-processing protein DprA [Nitrospirota bacterium]|nr:DNA-processing protein DprA [Nitrospirota bacterium]